MINTYKALSMSQAQTTLFVTITLGGRYRYFSFLIDEELKTKADLPIVIERIEPGPEGSLTTEPTLITIHLYLYKILRESKKSKFTESYLLDSSKLFIQLFQLVSYLLHRLLQFFQLL